MIEEAPASKTMLKRIEQYKDRWSSHGNNTGLMMISEKLSADELKGYEIFQDYPDNFLEKISPDVAVALWKEDSLLFEEGTYIDLAFFVVRGEVEVTLERQDGPGSRITPIFDLRGAVDAGPDDSQPDGTMIAPSPSATMIMDMVELSKQNTINASNKSITFLATMDFNLPNKGGARLGPGEFFGEIGALSGWPQSVTARTSKDCELIQIRLPALRLMKNKSKELKARLDDLYRERSLVSQLKSTPLFRQCTDSYLARLREQVELVSLQPGEVFAKQGEPADALYLVRSGFIKLIQRVGEGEMVATYLAKGMTLGEVELMMEGLGPWECTAQSVEYAELVKIPKAVVPEVLERSPGLEGKLWKSAARQIRETGKSLRDIGRGAFTSEALDKGLVQGNSMLLIDLDVCTRCDDCVRGCAATHEQRPRFVREGNEIANLLIPKSCYHCHDPVCLVGCPTGAIHRAGTGQVVKIDGEICIGCTTCARNCPYDAIVMHDMGETWPEDMVPSGLRGKKRLQASKCDMCADLGHEPACVVNCPQGCAIRVDSIDAIRDEMPVESGGQVMQGMKRARAKKSARWRKGFLGLAGVSLLVFAANVFLGDVAPYTNWGLGYGIAATVFLGLVSLFAVRRRAMKLMTKMGAGASRTWLYVHLYGGLMFMLLVLMHTGFKMPHGWLTVTLWLLSIWTVVTGLIGLGLQKWIPRALSSGLGTEVVFERIPQLIEDIRKRSEKLAAGCNEAVLAFYTKNLSPDLASPTKRFIYFVDITGGIRNRMKVFDYLKGFLSEAEKSKLKELRVLYKTKLEMDAHYTLQSTLRGWLYAHVPTSLLMILFVVFHIFAVLYY